MTEDLRRFGVTPRKSLTLRVGGGVEHSPHFWRGAVDGDGSLSLRLYGRGRRSARPYCSLVSASAAFVEQFEAFVEKVAGSAKAGVLMRRKLAGPIYSHVVTCSRTAALCRVLYAGCTIALPRKQALAEEIMRWDDPQARASRESNRTKLSEEEVRQIRDDYSAGTFTQIQLATRRGVSASLVSAIVLGKRRAKV